MIDSMTSMEYICQKVAKMFNFGYIKNLYKNNYSVNMIDLMMINHTDGYKQFNLTVNLSSCDVVS